MPRKQSKYIGVYKFGRGLCRWRAIYQVTSERWPSYKVSLGDFHTEEQAAVAYDNWARKSGKELNFPDGRIYQGKHIEKLRVQLNPEPGQSI